MSNDMPRSPKVVTDRELITGQNPGSASAVAAELLQRLEWSIWTGRLRHLLCGTAFVASLVLRALPGFRPSPLGR